MTGGVKYWNPETETWELLGGVGPRGPGIPMGGTAGQMLAKASGTDFDVGWAPRHFAGIAPARLLSGTTTSGQSSAIGPGTTAVQLSAALNGGDDFSMAVTPTENCWWDVQATALLNRGDATWGACALRLALSPADALVQGTAEFRTALNNSIGWVSATVRVAWALVAGTTYGCTANLVNQVATGQTVFWRGPTTTWMANHGARPR